MDNDSVQTSQAETVGTEFKGDNLVANATAYKADKRIVDAASGYDSLDDAIAALTNVWNALEDQVANGSRYTPAQEMGFGSENATTIALSILGRKPTVGATRKAFAKLGS